MCGERKRDGKDGELTLSFFSFYYLIHKYKYTHKNTKIQVHKYKTQRVPLKGVTEIIKVVKVIFKLTKSFSKSVLRWMECWIEWPLETLISVTGPPGPATHVTGIINIAIHITHHHHWPPS